MSFQNCALITFIYATTLVNEFYFYNDFASFGYFFFLTRSFGYFLSLHANFEYVEIHYEFWFFSNTTFTSMLKFQFHPIVNSEVYISYSF
jgi:hypothetical protein